MSEAVLDNAIEQIADGLTVDWNTIDKAAPALEREWAKSLRVLHDIVNLHREAAVDYEQTTLASETALSVSGSAPETWGKYRLANKVGEGSYGSVYRAWDSELERDVAIKILHRRVGDARLKDRLLQEGRALAKIRHNNVVNVLGVETTGDRVGLCMEFVRGKTLDDIVRGQGKMSAAEAVLIGEDLCRALSAVHRAGYIHRDVKAKNVMRDDTGRIVLMDFGTGRTAEPQEGKSDRAGTPLYMAPEVIEDGQASACSDVYSLGVLLYHLVTGDYPVKANSVDELRDAHLNRRHRWLSELRPDLPVGFMQVVERAIALDPEERYANASELLAALSNLKLANRSVIWRVAKPALGFGIFVFGVIGLGFLTSISFNSALHRSDFVDESIGDWLLWGVRTSIPPVFMLMLTLLALAPLVVTRRVIVAISARARRSDAASRRRVNAQLHRFRLDEAPVLAAGALGISAAAMAIVWWRFFPLLGAIVTDLSAGPANNLALLSPANVALHNHYRWVFGEVVILSIAVWYPVAKLVKGGQTLHPAMWGAGIIVTGIAIAFLHFPYRLLYHSRNDPFEAVSWTSDLAAGASTPTMRCYAIGERGDHMLIFCPQSSPPRNRVVKKDDVRLRHLGDRENIFSSFDTSVKP